MNDLFEPNPAQEIDLLRKLASDGFYPVNGMVVILTPEMMRARLPEEYWSKPVWGLNLVHENGNKRMFLFREVDTRKAVMRFIRETPAAGQHHVLHCSITGVDAVFGRTFDTAKIIECLRSLKKWDVRESKTANLFEIHFVLLGDDQSKFQKILDDVDRTSIALSLKTKNGFRVKERTCNSVWQGHDSAMIVVGIPTRTNDAVDQASMDKISRLPVGSLQLQAARALRDIYSQPVPRLQLLIGWGALEDLFKSKPEHILEKTEIKELVGLLDQHSTINCKPAVRKQIEEAIKNSQWLAKHTRNDRLAMDIVTATSSQYEITVQQVRDAAKARGDAAHHQAIGPESEDNHQIRQSVTFIESVFLHVVQQPCADDNERLGGEG